MKRTRIVLFFLLTLVLATGVSATTQSTLSKTAIAPSLTSTAAGLTSWFGVRIDPAIGSSDVRGQYPSIVVASGRAYVSYHDATNKDLMLAYYIGSSGNCGPSNAWNCSAIDSEGDVGQYTSLAVDASVPYLHLGIAYYDATNYALKYASYMCAGASCGANTYTIETPSGPGLVGQYASIKFDSSGKAHIAYQINSTTSLVGYAHQVGSGGNCGKDAAAGKWQCDVIETGGAGTGRYTSLDLNSYDLPRIAYYDADNGDLRYAVYQGSGTGNCHDTNWWCGKVSFIGDVGRFASLQIDRATNNAHIAYYDATNGKLKYAHWVGAGGNCGDTFGGETVWSCETIDTMGTNLTRAGIALAVDANGYPNIAYQDATNTQGVDVLKIARPAAAVDQSVGNCGPTSDFSFTWQCDVIDGAGADVDEGDYASLTFSPAGLANVAYYETDNLDSTGCLKVLQQQLQLPLPLILR